MQIAAHETQGRETLRRFKPTFLATLLDTEVKVPASVCSPVDGDTRDHASGLLNLGIWDPFGCFGTLRMRNLSRGFPWKYAFVMSAALSLRPSENGPRTYDGYPVRFGSGTVRRMSSSWPMCSKLPQATSLAFRLGVYSFLSVSTQLWGYKCVRPSSGHGTPCLCKGHRVEFGVLLPLGTHRLI